MYLYDMKNVWRQNKWPWIFWLVVNIFLLFLIVSSLQMININLVWESIMGNRVFFFTFPLFLYLRLLFVIKRQLFILSTKQHGFSHPY